MSDVMEILVFSLFICWEEERDRSSSLRSLVVRPRDVFHVQYILQMLLNQLMESFIPK